VAMSVLAHIEGHLAERQAEAREHLAAHLEELARRIRSEQGEPIGVAAIVLREDGSRDIELCCDGGVETLALASALDVLARSLASDQA
jgi:hypothetical protein